MRGGGDSGASADADRAGGLTPRVRLRGLGLSALIPCALAGCDDRPARAEWQERCVEQHFVPMMVPVSNGRSTTMVVSLIPVCDRHAPVCVGGKDGSTECPARAA